nr:galectin-10 [Pongo abelii]
MIKIYALPEPLEKKEEDFISRPSALPPRSPAFYHCTVSELKMIAGQCSTRTLLVRIEDPQQALYMAGFRLKGLHILTTVPHTQAVSLSTGSTVTIKGKPLVCFFNEPHLQVDFHTEMKEESDIAFHFQVHFGCYVVMNSREYGAWKKPVESKNMPFQDGQEFELSISVLSDKYQVMVNGQAYYTFDHRIPPEAVKMVQVWRDISLTKFEVSN